RTPTVAYDDAGPLVAFVEEHGLEGVVAKRVDSRYEPGRRSKAWIKHPLRLRQELVVGGWLEGEGARQGTIGALLLGYHDDDGRLHFAGRVGTGFTESELRMLKARLAELATDENPFDVGRVPKGAHFVEPSLVAEIRFNEW